jgi:hypothetical protein
MLAKCFNPDCARELHYLHDGRVVRVIRGEGDNISLEHYWLCGSCFQRHDFEFPTDGSVALRTRLGDKHAEMFYLRDVLLPKRHGTQR